MPHAVASSVVSDLKLPGRRPDHWAKRPLFGGSGFSLVANATASFELLAPDHFGVSRKGAIQIGCRADQRQMRECLREIPQMLPIRAELFGI